MCVRWGFVLGASDDYPFRAMRGAWLRSFPSICSDALTPRPHLAVGVRGVFALMDSFTPHSRPDVGSEDPLNLSISLSVGTETK